MATHKDIFYQTLCIPKQKFYFKASLYSVFCWLKLIPLSTSVDCIKCFWQFTISWWWMMWGVVIEKMCCTSLLCQHNELLLFLHRKQFSFSEHVTSKVQTLLKSLYTCKYTLHFYALYAGIYPSSSRSESYICIK